MAKLEHLNLLKRDVAAWNEWRRANYDITPDFNGADLRGANLADANLAEANLVRADLRGAILIWANLSEANLVKANLTGVDLTGANLAGADLSGADVSRAEFQSANLKDAFVTGIKWNRKTMRGKYRGIRGFESCSGDALYKRAALDQDYLDSLEHHWKGTWRAGLFWAWGLIDYGRSIMRVFAIALILVVLYGIVYSLWPELLGLTCNNLEIPCGPGQASPHSFFTPFYFSIVTYSTLGFGDIAPQTLWGEIIVCSEVMLGYLTLGLMMSVLAEKVARRS